MDCNQSALTVSLASDGVPRLWSPEGLIINTLQHSSQILNVQWDPSGTLILGTDLTGLTIWDSQGTLLSRHTHTHIREIKAAAWRSSSEYTVQTTTGLWLWRHPEDPFCVLSGASQDFRWSPDKRFLAITQGVQLAIYQDESGLWWISQEVTAFQFTYTEGKIAVGNSLGELHFWDLERRRVVSRVATSIVKISRIVFRRDDELVAACSEDEVQVWGEGMSFVRKIKTQGRINDM